MERERGNAINVFACKTLLPCQGDIGGTSLPSLYESKVMNLYLNLIEHVFLIQDV